MGLHDRASPLLKSSVRLVKFGPNDVARIRQRPIILQFLDHFKNFLVIILLLAAVISAFTGGVISAVIIIIIVLISVTLDFFQEYKAGHAADLLRQKIITKGYSSP